MWYKNVGPRFSRFVTNHAFYRQTNRPTVKTVTFNLRHSVVLCQSSQQFWNVLVSL